MLLKIDQEFKDLIPAQQDEEHKALEDNLIKNGFDPAYPLIVWEGILIDGHNRHELCLKHGIEFKTIEKQFANRSDAYNWIIENQLSRRNITKEQKRYLIGKRYTNEKKTVGAPIGNSNKINGVTSTPLKSNPHETATKIATQNKVSEKTVRTAETFSKAVDELSKNTGVKTQDILSQKIKATQKDIQNLAKSTPEKQKEVVKRVKENKAKSIKQAMQQVKEEELKARPTPKLEEKKDILFEVILADPPWRYDFSSTENRGIENQYPTMEIYDICNIKVPAAKDCILFMWATAPKLREAFKVIDAWGFEYKTNAVWDKQKIGMGYYFRGQHELLLVATKGNPGTPDASVRPSSVISESRTTHSTKPEIVYELIEKMYPGRLYIEMFARNKREGWGSWGNQV